MSGGFAVPARSVVVRSTRLERFRGRIPLDWRDVQLDHRRSIIVRRLFHRPHFAADVDPLITFQELLQSGLRLLLFSETWTVKACQGPFLMHGPTCLRCVLRSYATVPSLQPK